MIAWLVDNYRPWEFCGKRFHTWGQCINYEYLAVKTTWVLDLVFEMFLVLILCCAVAFFIQCRYNSRETLGTHDGWCGQWRCWDVACSLDNGCSNWSQRSHLLATGCHCRNGCNTYQGLQTLPVSFIHDSLYCVTFVNIFWHFWR